MGTLAMIFVVSGAATLAKGIMSVIDWLEG